MVYFDYTATTPVDEEVLNTYINTTKKFFANTTSLHSLGEESKHMYEVCMNKIKDTLNIKNHNIIFTSNATEANNLAILGVANKYEKGKIITTKGEHASVYNCVDSLKDNFDIVYLDILSDGRIDLEQLKREMNNDVVLVSVMWVNNVIGTVNNIKEVINIVKNYKKCHLHVDCVQGMAKVVNDFDFNDIDLFTISAHKIYGPKGIGCLFVRNNIELEKRIYGSNAQYGIKPGTIDLSLIASCAKAIMKFYPLTSTHLADVKEKYEYLYNKLSNIDGLHLNSPKVNVSYYILSASLEGVRGETMVHFLEARDLYVSTGSSCSSRTIISEKTILAMTKSDSLAQSSIRISLSFLTKYEEIDKLIGAIEEMVKELKHGK